jgi:hypothetical protein
VLDGHATEGTVVNVHLQLGGGLASAALPMSYMGSWPVASHLAKPASLVAEAKIKPVTGEADEAFGPLSALPDP